jgi:hypothetical protein
MEMKVAMNRSIRRKLRRSAAEISRVYVARGIVVAGTAGGVARLENEDAKRIVRQEIHDMLRQGAQPRLRRLSDAEALTFPFMGDAPSDAVAWLAVALSKDGRAALVTRWMPAASADETSKCARLRLAVLAELEAECSRPGLPMPREVAGHA